MELALAVDGEVVNCDAMQVYKGLPIAAQILNEQGVRTCSASSTLDRARADTEDAGINVQEFGLFPS